MRRLIAPLAHAAALVAGPAAAQETPPPREGADIVVTGRGLAASPGEAAFATTEIDRDRIAASASARLEDVLRDVAGIQSFRRSDSRSANPTSQGIGLRGLGGNASSRALLILDGVPQSDPFGGWIAFPAYATGRVARIRVSRGGSGIAGPGALAGTIELDSVGGGAGGADLAVGSRDAVDAQAGWGFVAGDGFATVHGQYARGDGFVPIIAGDRGPADRAAGYEQASLAVRGVVPIAAAAELQASLAGFTDRRTRGLAFTDTRSEGADASVRLVGRGAWGWSLLGYVQTRGFASRFASVDAARATVTPTLDQYSVPSTGLGGRFEIAPPIGRGWTLRAGGDLRAVEGVTHELFSFVAGTPTRRREAGGRATTMGAFADAAREAGAWTFTAGGRLDHWRIADGRLDERVLAGGVLTADRFADRAGWQPTGRLGAAWRAGEGAVLRAAAYRGWRLPTLNELYRPFRLGPDATAANAALRPETLRGAEMGFDLTPRAGMRLSLTGFVNRLDDAIANVAVARGPGTFPGVGFVSAAGIYRRRDNLGRIASQGIELDARATLGEAWSLGAGWAYSDARVSGAALDGLRPAQTPAHQASAHVDWRRARSSAGLTARYVGPQFEDDANQRRLAGAVTFDARAVLALSRTLSAELRGENLADARVEAAIGADGAVERASPRTLWLGLSLAR